MITLFDDTIRDLRKLIQNKSRGHFREVACTGDPSWPAGGKRDLVLQADAALELGSPKDESVSFILWTEDLSLVRDGAMTLIGPDIGEIKSKSSPFGKVAIIGGTDFIPENCYDRYLDMDQARYEVSLKGYMMRAVSQHMREWSRIHREAWSGGLSLFMLGSALVQRYRRLDYVHSVELLFITESNEAVRELAAAGEQAVGYLGAIRRMSDDSSMECETCDYQQVCDGVEDLKKIHEAVRSGK
jgi:CO dehydrogenase/acetyl-CoA synthase beta subunit